mmetsp:Transcript_2936/g.3972  ORF Transcript_2936/g.3972 Transcript_2936/m.3972 type:complete len:387 (+) Transcript_2936:173-1333(+)
MDRFVYLGGRLPFSVSSNTIFAFVSGLFCGIGGIKLLYKFFPGIKVVNGEERKIREDFVDLIGNTPMVCIQSLSKETGCRILGKCEYLNPGGSSKDRVAKNIVLEAEARGVLKKGGVIVEGTSGSTGISLAQVAKAKGYECYIVMPDDQAEEKSNILKALGAKIKLVKPASIVNQGHYVNEARKLSKEIEGGFFANQFENLSNFRAHACYTGQEIWEQCDGDIDCFVMSSGTGGTISGVGTFLKAQNPKIIVALADPQGSSLYHKIESGVLYTQEQAERTLKRHRYDTITEGIGSDRLTTNMAAGLQSIDEAHRVTDKETTLMARYILRNDGLFIGSSSALNLVVAKKLALRLGPGHTIVTILCGSGSRELTKLHNPEYIKQHLNI